MRNTWKIWLASALMGGTAAWAASTTTPAAAPAAMQTFVCKDGTSVSAATSKGACKGHKGIDTSATAAPAPAPAKAKAAAAPAKAAPAQAVPTKAGATPAPGGGPGKVWVNETSKVYHCQGDRYYGTTKNGKYMTEAEAKAAGMHGAKNKTCT